MLFLTAVRSTCTATEPVHVLRERNGDDFERLGHRRVDMHQVDEVIGRRSKTQGHRRLVNDLARIDAEHRDADDAAALAFEHHLDDPPCVADGSGSRHRAHGDGVALADDAAGIGLLVRQPHDGHLGIGEDGARDNGMIHLAWWLSREGIVGSDLAIVGANRGGHLALGLAPDHITGCPDMRDARPQVLIDAHCSSRIESDSHPLAQCPGCSGVAMSPPEAFLR